MILDVGCGNRPRGNVNLDLYPKSSGHRPVEIFGFGNVIDVKRVPNFIVGDACHLPFRDNVFDVVVSYHTIEHVCDPRLLLRELVRVSNFRVIVVCPFWLMDRHHIVKVVHRHKFGKKWFVNVLNKMGVTFEIVYDCWRCFPHVFVPLIRLPLSLKITIWKS